jgi:hypothetical protein
MSYEIYTILKLALPNMTQFNFNKLNMFYHLLIEIQPMVYNLIG